MMGQQASTPVLPDYDERTNPSPEFYDPQDWEVTRHRTWYLQDGTLRHGPSPSQGHKMVEVFHLPANFFTLFSPLPTQSKKFPRENSRLENFQPEDTEPSKALPLEIRFQVWEFTLPPPTVIHLLPHPIPRNIYTYHQQIAFENIRGRGRLPFATMSEFQRTCKEQRDFFWSNYTFLDLTSLRRHKPLTDPRVMIDLRRDTILIDMDIIRYYDPQDQQQEVQNPIPPFLICLDFSRLQNLAVQFSTPTWEFERAERLKFVCDAGLLLPQLKTLTIVISSSYDPRTHPTRGPNTAHRLLEIEPDFLDMDAVRMPINYHRAWANSNNIPFNQINPQTSFYGIFTGHFGIREYVKEADDWRERYATAVADPKYKGLGERRVQFKVAASAHFEDWTLRHKEVYELKPRNPKWSMVSFFTKGWSHRNSGIVIPKPKRERFVLGIDEFFCYAKANEDGTLRVGYHGLEDVRLLFQK